ncbi:MAG: hypothetical protein ACXW11_12215 [Methylotenera sp.]
MIKSIFICAITLLVSPNAFATCASLADTWFSCATKAEKRIELCNEKTKIRYTFGPINGKAEITLLVPKEKASTSQPDGQGRWYSYAVDIPNGKTIYTVFWGYDRRSEENDVEAGVHVTTPNGDLPTVYCLASGEITNNLDGVDLQPTK